MFLPMCYAEVHHKRWIIPNFLWQDEPEIFADFPRRLEPGADVFPVVLNIKDADKFPVVLTEVHVTFMGGGGKHEIQLFKGNAVMDKRLAQILFKASIKGPGRPSGHIPVAVKVHYFHKGKKKVIFNHNYKTASKELWFCNFSAEALPSVPDWHPGDIHWHSSMSEDDIEFGQDPANAVQLARVSGLKYLAVTDHSYDLDDVPGKYLEKDETLAKWHASRADIKKINDANVDFTLISGEEASLGSSAGRNIHALILGNDDFVPGTGDSADRPFFNRPDSYLSDFKGKGIVIAAHPFEGYSPLPYLFLRRGGWSDADLEQAGGMEFYNGLKNRGYEKGKAKWLELLLKGRKLFAYGGSDAHGDFIRMFKVKIPFLKLRVCDDHLTGTPLTYVYCGKQPNEALLLDALRSGHCFVSDGPAIDFKIEVKGGYLIPGDSMELRGTFSVSLRVVSSEEFGGITSVRLFRGDVGKSETLIADYGTSDYDTFFETSVEITERCYVRAEADTDAGKIAFTNPVFFD